MQDKSDIRLRLIQQNSNRDKENHFALQRSVEVLKNWKGDKEQEWKEWSWKELFNNENRIWYVFIGSGFGGSGKKIWGRCKSIIDTFPSL